MGFGYLRDASGVRTLACVDGAVAYDDARRTVAPTRLGFRASDGGRVDVELAAIAPSVRFAMAHTCEQPEPWPADDGRGAPVRLGRAGPRLVRGEPLARSPVARRATLRNARSGAAERSFLSAAPERATRDARQTRSPALPMGCVAPPARARAAAPRHPACPSRCPHGGRRPAHETQRVQR
jgi:hypothetical protein